MDIFSHSVENGIEKAAIIFAHLGEKDSAYKMRDYITIEARQQKVTSRMNKVFK